ncbi:MAG: dCTP deaminase [Synergistaceae bacterium]|nr:dCTP deaminase [Synergistaceae bacterium]MBR0233861.1 dCTP deaminase [Synergistaceae bacterium]MBR0253846.1 dCTP deaminase [Synergistaceae bacterium]MBR0316959.1 dCTP deaminase [Synergistaceae bacterium]
MILSGLEIKKHINREIIIDPFDESRLNPNSYNLSLHNELLIYTNKILDMKQQNQTQKILIPSEGYLLEPGKLYLGRTNEFTKTEKFIPMLEGRSSIGRLGICIHVTAGFGDVGFAGYWTLELFCVQPVKIYPDVQIAQIYYHTITEPYERYTKGKYQNNKGIQASMLYKEFNI